MDIKAVMEEVAERLDTIAGLRVFDHPQKAITPPVAFVTYPDTYTYDETYGRGTDRLSLGVWVSVGDVYSKGARDALSEYTAGSGAKSVKAVLDGDGYDSCDEVTVQQVEFDPVTIGATTYMGAMFTLDVVGPGTTGS